MFTRHFAEEIRLPLLIFPHSFHHKRPERVPAVMVREQLQQLANALWEGATQAAIPDVRSVLFTLSGEAERWAKERIATERDLREAHTAIAAAAHGLRNYGRWREGEHVPEIAAPLPHKALPAPPRPGPPVAAPMDALRPSELARIYAMPVRTACDIIDKAVSAGWPGFYRDGRKLFADQDAFARAPRVRKRRLAGFLPMDGDGVTHAHGTSARPCPPVQRPAQAA